MSSRDKNSHHLFPLLKMTPGLIHKLEYILRFWSSAFDLILYYSQKAPNSPMALVSPPSTYSP